MKVIVGLGNPGQTYRDTRHNVGFMVIHALADHHHVQLSHSLVSPLNGRPVGMSGTYQEAHGPVQLLMPFTMMNESGEALRPVQVSTQDLLIVCDDANLPLGAIRLRAEGSAGGHHGLQSCLEVLGTERVPRLRLGIGVELLPNDLREFVLSSFSRTERPIMRQMIAQGVDACEVWVKDGIAAAMNRHN